MTDDLYARLRAANPVPGSSAVESADSPRTHTLMEAAMSTNPTSTPISAGAQSTEAQGAGAQSTGAQSTGAHRTGAHSAGAHSAGALGGEPPPRRSFLFPLGLVAAAAGVVVAGSMLIPDLVGDSASPSTPAALTLALPGGDAASSCAPVSVEVLRAQEVAFGATATSIADSSIGLDVDTWYKGGPGSQVRLSTGPDLVGYSIDFQEGERYLVSASGGSVSICGLSGEATTELESLFDLAFPR